MFGKKRQIGSPLQKNNASYMQRCEPSKMKCGRNNNSNFFQCISVALLVPASRLEIFEIFKDLTYLFFSFFTFLIYLFNDVLKSTGYFFCMNRFISIPLVDTSFGSVQWFLLWISYNDWIIFLEKKFSKYFNFWVFDQLKSFKICAIN